MKAEELLHKMLEIQSPWQIVRIREDLGKGQIDVWIGRQTGKSGWLFGNRSTATIPEEREQVWRHVNLGDTRCLIHAAPIDEAVAPAWSGEAGLPFSHALSRRIAAMMREGVKLQSICTLLDLTVSDLWKFKHTLDNGKAGLSGAQPVPAEAGAASAVPAPDHPVWERLLDGSLDIDIRLLSLKFMLAKLREQMRLISDAEVRVLKAYELQRYFVRYESALGHELAQLATA